MRLRSVSKAISSTRHEAGEIAGDLAADLGQRHFHRIAAQGLLAVLIDLLQVVAQRGIDEQVTVLVHDVRARRPDRRAA
jgi:hypothetical protein